MKPNFLRIVLVSVQLFSSLSFAQFSQSTPGSEQVEWIEVTNGQQVRNQIFSQCVPLKPGKVADIRAQTEITNDLGYIVGIGYAITVWDYAGNRFIRKYDVDPAVMTNATPDIHHLVIQKSTLEQMKAYQDVTTRCYTLSVWAVGVKARPGHKVKVEKGYGTLKVFVH